MTLPTNTGEPVVVLTKGLGPSSIPFSAVADGQYEVVVTFGQYVVESEALSVASYTIIPPLVVESVEQITTRRYRLYLSTPQDPSITYKIVSYVSKL